MDRIIEEWIKMSEYDLQTAKVMLETGRYLYVPFMCQQSVEKLLKAVFCHVNNSVPPRTHNLLYLVDILKLNITDTQKTLLSQLNKFYLDSRYPIEQNQMAQDIDVHKAQDFWERTKELWQCLRPVIL